MKVILHDLGPEYEALINSKCDRSLAADGKYAPCQGCFGRWTKHPAECLMKDKLHEACRYQSAAAAACFPSSGKTRASRRARKKPKFSSTGSSPIKKVFMSSGFLNP